jgi:predicted glycoside hydrolase/deacetylase ChbG (UPF0249 family)
VPDLKKIILCADDFGLNTGVSEGVLKLAKMGRLSAVSCMVNASSFKFYAHELQNLSELVQIGLHFNLTEGFFLAHKEQHCFSLQSLLLKTHLRKIAFAFIKQEFLAQLDCFISIMGRAPEFIDGHQHVHQFPIIRDVLLELYSECLKASNVTIRSTYPLIFFPAFRFKNAVLAYTGGKALNKVLNHLNIPHNKCFAGIYDFSPTADYRSLFQHWLSLAPKNTLIMCHPGEGVSEGDVIAAARIKEMAYFSSDEFLEDCAAYRVVL